MYAGITIQGSNIKAGNSTAVLDIGTSLCTQNLRHAKISHITENVVFMRRQCLVAAPANVVTALYGYVAGAVKGTGDLSDYYVIRVYPSPRLSSHADS